MIIITEAIQLLKDSCKAINEAIEETSRLYKDAAKKLLELPCDEFAQWLESTLQCVIVYAQGKTCQISRDKLWMKFQESRSTTDQVEVGSISDYFKIAKGSFSIGSWLSFPLSTLLTPGSLRRIGTSSKKDATIILAKGSIM